MTIEYSCEPMGDSAVIISFGDSIDVATNNWVHEAARLLSEPSLTGVLDIVPAYSSLTLYYNCYEINVDFPYQAIKEAIVERLSLLTSSKTKTLGRFHEIPVCYDPPFGLDLKAVARHCSLSEQEVIEAHCQPEYRVYFLGFVPGFPYLGGMNPALNTPRKASPELVIPAGSVAIAGGQTGIYPLETPGGWQVIGRTPLALVDFNQPAPTLLQAGDRLRFRAITASEFDDWGNA